MRPVPPVSTATTLPELQRRLIFSALRPAARLASRFHLPWKTLEELARLAYFEELRRRRGASHTAIARVLDLSLRSVGSLEKLYRSDFLAPERELEFARRVEEAFDQGPTTVEAVALALAADPAEVERVVEGLLGAGRLLAQPDGALSLDRRFRSLVQADLKARIDGLNHQLDVLVAAVQARFFTADRPAMARTLTFVATPEAI